MRAEVRTKRVSRPDILMLGLRSLGSAQGGVEAHASHLAHEVDKAGYVVEAVVRTPYAAEDGESAGAQIRITKLWSPQGKATEAIIHSLYAVLYAAWRRPRVVHVHAIGPSLVVPIARGLGLNVVMTHHGEDYNREKWGRFARWVLQWGERLGTRFANERICVSSSLSRALSDRYRVPFHYIPNGVRRPGAVSSTSALDKFGLTPGNYILHVGRLVAEKRQLDLVEALRALDRPGLKLVLVGAADHESEYSREITRRAAGCDNVVLTGFQSGLALTELFSHAGAFALPSSHEGLPIALLEAMSYGCPIVASDIEANQNIELPEECYFELGAISDLAEKLKIALAHGAAGARVDWNRYLARFDWPDVAAQTIEVYASAIGPGSRGFRLGSDLARP